MNTLDKLLAWARTYKMTPEEEAKQKASFVYGNVVLANPFLRREEGKRT